VDSNDSEQSVVSVLRSAAVQTGAGPVVAAFNFTPVPRPGYRLGVPMGGFWRELLNSDAEAYGGSGWGNQGGVQAEEVPWHGRPHSLATTLPPLGAVFLAPEIE
jgi:1,4-alpha-glucan branching enzyme